MSPSPFPRMSPSPFPPRKESECPLRLSPLRLSPYRGLWVANRNPKGPPDEVVDLKLKLNGLGSKPLPTPPNRRPRPGTRPVQEYPSMTFRWDRPNYVVEMKPGETFPVQPLADAKPAK